MTTAPLLTSRDIGRAENALRALLLTQLAEPALSYQQWVALHALATTGSTAHDVLVGRVADGLKISPSSVEAVLGELAQRRLMGDPSGQVVLTDEGKRLHDRLWQDIAAVSARIYRDLPDGELAAAYRVISVITERASAELSG
jgi:DNA-binding MarR family transcriptional regulator